MSHDEALDVHANFLPTPYLEALRSAGVTTVDNGIPVPGWEVGQALSVRAIGTRNRTRSPQLRRSRRGTTRLLGG
jgi:hypothetical protein